MELGMAFYNLLVTYDDLRAFFLLFVFAVLSFIALAVVRESLFSYRKVKLIRDSIPAFLVRYGLVTFDESNLANKDHQYLNQIFKVNYVPETIITPPENKKLVST